MKRLLKLLLGGLLLSTSVAFAQTMMVVSTSISAAVTIAKIVNRVVQNGKDEHFDTRAYITTNDHYTDDISYSYDGSAGDNIIGYLIEDVSEKPSKDGYLRANNVTVSTANGNPFGIRHHHDGEATHTSFGQVKVGNLQVTAQGTSSDDNKVTAYGVYQASNVSLGGIDGVAVDIAGGLVATTNTGATAIGLRGGTYNATVDLTGLQVSSAKENAVGIYLDSTTSIANISITSTDEANSNMKVTSQNGVAVGIYGEGGKVIGNIENYNIHVSTSFDDNPNVDSSAIGIHLDSGTSIGGISNVNIDAKAYNGLAVGMAVNTTDGDVSVGSINNLNIVATSEYGRAVGVATSDNNKIPTITNSTISVNARGDVYGIAFGKDMSAKTDDDSNYSTDPIGGIALYNNTSKDSSNINISNAVINVKSTGARYITETEYKQSAYGIYIADSNYHSNDNIFNVEASGNAYGAYISNGENYVYGTLNAKSTASNAYGIFASDKAYAYATNDNGSAPKYATIVVETSQEGRSSYGVYAQSESTISDAVSITSISNNENTAYGAYLDNGKLRYSGYVSSSIIAKNTSEVGSAYGIYAKAEADIYTYSLNNSYLSILAESNGTAYGMYVDNSTLTTGSHMNIDVQADTLAYGVYLLNSTNDANLSGTYSVYAKNGKSVGISINDSEVSKISANVYTKSENVVNSEAVGIEINSVNSDINVAGNVSVSVNGEVNSTHNGIGYTGVLIENVKNVKIGSTITVDTTSTGASKLALYNMRAVETKVSNEITFDNAILTTYNNEGVAIKSTGTDLTFSGTATFNGDVVAGTYSFKVGELSDKYNVNVNSGSFVINSPKIHADVLKLGSAEGGIAEFNLVGSQTEFDVNTIAFYAESLTSYSKINVNETEVLAFDKFDVQIEFAEDFTFNAGDTLVLFEVDSPNTITISALESKDAIISIGNTILDSKLFTWKQFETGDKTGFGIEFNAVPEPSEWALIFGTFAFGFVMYRRRK